jgi:hypothetical protein
MTVGLEVLIAILGAGLAVATYFGGRQASAKSVGASDAEQRASLNSLKEWFELTRKKSDALTDEFTNYKIDIAKIEARVATNERNMAGLDCRLTSLEKGLNESHVKWATNDQLVQETVVKVNAIEALLSQLKAVHMDNPE